MHSQRPAHLCHTVLSQKHSSFTILNDCAHDLPRPLLLSPGPQAASKVPSQVFPHARPLSRNSSGPPSVQLCEDGPGQFAWGSFLLWIQSSDTVLLHTR